MTGVPTLEPFGHRCVRASAGSGKTYRLTSRYLALAAAGAPVGSMLASTFTRIAAGEIRDRILMRLALAATDEARRRELGEALSREIDAAQVMELLRSLTSQLNRMQIRTLDSFFASVVRAFALELGVPPESTIADEDQARRLRLDAIRSMLDEHETPRMAGLLGRLTPGTSGRSVVRVLDQTMADLYEVYREAGDEAWACVRPAKVPALDVAEAIAHLEAWEPPAGSSLEAAHLADVERARRGDWNAFLSTGVAGKLADGDSTYGRAAIDPSLAERYRPVIAYAEAILINRLREQTLATRDLLALFDTHYRAAKRARRAITFADLTASMLDAEKLGRFEEICFRIDARIQHLLLDEFQDTNIQQWRALEPIVLELISDETQPRSFFCVGDVKQSIYGWRDACPEVLDAIPRLLSGPDGVGVVRAETLALSRRSSPVVIEAVNRVFGGLPDNGALAEDRDAAVQFHAGFETHATTVGEGGRVALRTVAAPPERRQSEPGRARAAVDLVTALHAEGVGTIAVLVRTNQMVARLLNRFRAVAPGVPASGRGGGSLTESPVVETVLDAVRMADHPDDTIAAFNVAGGPLGAVLDFADARDTARRRAVARLIRRQLHDQGYARLLARWVRALAPSCDGRQYRRLVQLVELAGEYEPRATLRPGDFATMVEMRTVADTSPAPVQVMTVHQSKGLEFDTVVLPDLQWVLTGAGHPPVVLQRATEAGPIERICRWASRSARRPQAEELEPMFERHRRRTVRESLCLLYVAMTRARSRLHMLIDPSTGRGPGRTPAGVLHAALASETRATPETVLYSDGAAVDASPPAPVDREAAAAASPPIVLAAPRGEGRRRRAEAASRLTGPLTRELRLDDAGPRDRGSAMHRLFEEIEWIETWTADRDRLERLVRGTAPRRGAAWTGRLVDDFLAALERPAVRGVLARGSRDAGRVRVWRERPFAWLVKTAGGERRVQEGNIDRLVAEVDEAGRTTRAAVIDFKTDQIEAAEAEAHAASYRPQLETYRAVAARMLGVAPAAVSATVLFVHPGEAVALGTEPAEVQTPPRADQMLLF